MRSDTYRGSLMLAWWTAVLLGFTLAFQYGCRADASPRDKAQRGLAIMADVVVAADQQVAARFPQYRERCLDEDTEAEARACLEPIYTAYGAVVSSKDILRSAQSSLDTSTQQGLGEVAPCAAQAVARLTSALTAAGLEIPDEAEQARSLLEAIGGTCEVRP